VKGNKIKLKGFPSFKNKKVGRERVGMGKYEPSRVGSHSQAPFFSLFCTFSYFSLFIPLILK
jgi:hypothetical protein